ncbi:AAA family ATPase, partial [Candidatus Binatus sp.]|uniref:AAA family ATPase n=1 Tax=Candidatus Binatus sp. TaxID=2811406 RepID=UPI003C3C0943
MVHLERIPLELLFLLAERPGEIVSRQEILERVWGKSIFIDTDSGINTAVRKVRRALQDDADTPRYLVAVPGRGYRFVGRIHEPEAQETRHGAEPLVGRVREVAALQASLAKAVAGHQGFVMISGEAGIGKSRLTEELIILAERDGMEVLIGHCVDPEESAPYLPFVEVLDVCVDRAETSADLRRLLGEEGPELAHLIPKISRTLPDLATKSLHLPAPEAQQLLFKSYRDFLTRLAEQKTILLVLEDLHWADDSTFALLRHLMQRMSGVAILVIGTYRDTELDVTPGLSRTLEESFRAGFNKLIRLEGLPSDEVGEMLGRLSGRVPSPQVVREVHEATAGNPFFVRELFRHLEAENRLYDAAGDFRPALKIAETEVPRSVKLLVRSRLDRINADTKHMLGIAALAGQSFTLEVLQAVIKSDRLVESIEQAERAGLVRSIPGSTAGRFVFSHELVRQAVIGGLAAVRRQRLHLELGASIELVYARTLDDHFADLAYHYRRGGNTRKAVEFLSRAAAQAIERAADAQALELATFAMDLLRRLPDDADRGRLELSIQLSYCNALRATEGLAAEALRQPLDRALKLSEQIGDQNSTILVLDSLRAFHQLKSEIRHAQQIGERFVALAELSGDPVALARSSMSIGQTLLLVGRFGEARQRFELAVGSADFDRIEGSQAAWWKTDALAGLAYALWLLGFPEEAERRLMAMLDAARPNPLAQAFG